MNKENLLSVNNLIVSYDEIEIVRNLSFKVNKGEFLGIAGESGCGKTTLLKSLMLLGKKGSSIKGSIEFSGKDLTKLDKESIRKIRGKDIALIPQNAFSAMDSTKTISSLFNETMNIHSDRKIRKSESDNRALKLMESLSLKDCERILKSYPFELSGGMCQRIMIAVSLINDPQLLLADEFTSALDIKSQSCIMKELNELKEKQGIAMVMISHNISLLSELSDTVAIMYGGKIVEYGSKEEIISNPLHPYTKALFDAVPKENGRISKGLPGLPPEFTKEMRGCPFAERCPYAESKCFEEEPGDNEINANHRVKCFLMEVH